MCRSSLFINSWGFPMRVFKTNSRLYSACLPQHVSRFIVIKYSITKRVYSTSASASRNSAVKFHGTLQEKVKSSAQVIQRVAFLSGSDAAGQGCDQSTSSNWAACEPPDSASACTYDLDGQANGAVECGDGDEAAPTV
jgi:hypothetical protein